MVRAACFESREIAGSNTTLTFKIKRNKMFLPRSLVTIPYYGEPPWPRGSVLGLRLPELEFRILCWRAVSSHTSHHPQGGLMAQFSLHVHKGGIKPHWFHFISTIHVHGPILDSIFLKKSCPMAIWIKKECSFPANTRCWPNTGLILA